MGELEKKKLAGLVMTLVIVVFIAVYWANEPDRQAAASERFLHESMTRGAELYRQACVQCHGQQGQGVVGPALKGTRLDEKALEKVISRGVPQSPMPAWGQEDGGPLKPNQIQDLATFIQNWDDPLLNAGTTATPTPTAIPGTTTPPATSQPATPPPTSTLLPVEAGRQLFSNLGCAACHGTNAEGSQIAPALAGLAGKDVEMTSGQKVVADDAYLKESINAPDAKVVKGYQPGLMPKYDLADSQLNQLIEFIKSIK